ncbi:MAG: pyruvate kinase [Gammaproteobacteria bacterium]|jgi:pyruvate kinase|nr:pyruvate kinase [Gammaproteobacteria bacterium]
MRRTKILATLGPASEDPEVLRGMIRAGLNAVRCNFSHGTAEDHANRVALVRKIAAEEGKTIGILADLQGPKIRVAKFKDKKVTLAEGAEFVLDADLDKEVGDEHQVGIDYKALPQDVKSGDTLLLDDGRIVFKVKNVQGNKVICEVVEGGILSNNKGINKLGGGLTAPALTDKDKRDIITAASLKVDYVAVSFPRSAADMNEARELLAQAGCKAGLIAKIERTEAVRDIDEIIKASEGVMVARGDLAVEIGEEYVPGVQKKLIQRSRELDRIVITATQMMESMIENASPTRAEVSDVANAVLDGTDAVMLSAETASGKHPIKVIKAMDKICRAAEQNPATRQSRHRVECYFNRVDEAIAMASMYVANHLDVKAILALTESGSTPLWMSRISSHLPIYALTRNIETMGKVTLYRGVEPVQFDSTKMPKHEVNAAAIQELSKRKVVELDDLVLLTAGDHMGEHGGTNQLKVLKVNTVNY